MSHVVKIEFLIFPKEIQRCSHTILKHLALLLYENQNSKTFALRLNMNLLQFSGTSNLSSLFIK